MAKGSFVEWETLEYPLRERRPDWFVAVAIVAFAASVAAVILGNYIFAVLIMIGTAAMLLYAARIPKKITIRIYEKGIHVDSLMYPYETLRSFFIDEHTGKLLVRTDKFFMPILSIHIEDMAPEKIKNILLPNIAEEPIEESFWERLLEHVGF